MIDVSIDASRGLERLQKIHDNLLTEVTKGVTQSATIIRDFAKARHRFLSRSGYLEWSVDKTETVSNSGFVVAAVYLDLGKAPYGKFIHGGTKSHFVGPPKNAKALSWIDPYTGKRCFSKGHMVSGIKRDAFLYEAVTLRADAVSKIIADSVKKAVNI
jgi:hypothetical protein